MKSLSIALVIAALLGAPSSLAAQETKTARGTVSAVADDSLTLKMADHEMKFAIDSKTAVEVVGGGTRARRAGPAGARGGAGGAAGTEADGADQARSTCDRHLYRGGRRDARRDGPRHLEPRRRCWHERCGQCAE